jgi:hypothetical protein
VEERGILAGEKHRIVAALEQTAMEPEGLPLAAAHLPSTI